MLTRHRIAPPCDQSRAAFFSSVFGVVHKRLIVRAAAAAACEQSASDAWSLVQPFEEVTAIRRSSSRRVFGAIEVVYGPHRLVLTSFWDRDKAATALLDQWLASGSSAARLFLDSVEKPGVGVGPGAVPARGDDAESSESSGSESSEPEATTPQPEPPKQQTPVNIDAETEAHGMAEATDADSSPGPTAEHLGSLLDAARQTKELLLSPPAPLVPSALGGGEAPTAIPALLPTACALAPPAPPAEGAAPLPVSPDGEASAELDCTPAEFFALFLADGSRFTEAFRSARGEREVEVQRWRDDAGDGGAACRRVVTFRAPLDAMKGMRLPGIPHSTRIREEQRCAFHDCSASGEGEPQLIVLDSTSSQLDIPYGDAFVLEARLQLRDARASASGAPPRCAASVAFRVRWLKSPPRLPGIKHKIESTSRESTAEAYRMLFSMAQGYLRRWQQVASAAGGSARKRGAAHAAPRAPKAPRGNAGGASNNPRLEAALAKLDAATADDIRAALGLPQPAGGQAVTESASSSTAEPKESSASSADESSASPKPPDIDDAPSPRSKAADLAALRQSMVPSSAVAFGAVVDALQLAADTLKEQGLGEGASMAHPPGLRRAVLAAMLLTALLLCAAASYIAGLRRGSHAAMQPVLPAPPALACDSA